MGKICSTEQQEYLVKHRDSLRTSHNPNRKTLNNHYSFASIAQSSPDQQAVYNHPVCLKDGSTAYEIHTFFEEALGITFLQESKKLKPYLSLIPPDRVKTRAYHEKFTALTVHQYLQDTEPYRTDPKAITSLLRKMDETLRKLIQKKPTYCIDKEEVVIEVLLFTLMNLPSEIKSYFLFDSEDPSPEVLKNTLAKMNNQELQATLNPIFTRMAKHGLKPFVDCDDSGQILGILQIILAADPRAIEIFVKHQHFLPADNNTSIFGVLLSVTCFADEFGDGFYDLEGIDKQVVKNLLNDLVEEVFKHMQSLMKNGYEENIAKWFVSMLEFFEQRLKDKDDLSSMKSYQGLFFNYLKLIFKFLEEPLQNFENSITFISQIDLNSLQKFSLIADQPLLNGKTNQLNQDINFSFKTQLAFIACHAIGLYENIANKFLKNHKDLFSLVSLGPITFLRSDAPQSFGFTIQALDEKILTQFSNTISLQIMLILHSYGINLENHGPHHNYWDQTDQIQSAYFEDKPSLPVSWFENMINCLFFLRKANSLVTMGPEKQCGFIISFLAGVVQNKDWITSTSLRAHALSFLTALAPAETGFSLAIYQTVFKFIATEKPSFIQALIRLFVDCEKLVGKFSIRGDCCCLLFSLLREKVRSENNEYTSTIFEDLTPNETEICLKFATAYLNDLMHLFESLKKIDKVIELEQRLENEQALDFVELLVFMMDRDNVKASNELIQNYLTLGIIMSKFSVPFFLSDETKDKLALTLNFILSSFSGKNANFLEVMKPHQGLDYNPGIIVKKILALYLNFSQKQEFLLEVVSDEQNFSFELFQKTTKIIVTMGLLETDHFVKWEGLVESLKQKEQEKENEEKLMGEIEDIPQEYLDTLMNTIMKEPVMLPASKVVVDRTTIRKHLLTNSTDPFNRSPLTAEMLIPQPELKQKITEFVELRKVAVRGM